MPVLTNQRWERLAQELAQNKTATEAMQLAGYSDPRNSTRLTKKDEIRRRVEELQSRGAERAEVSVASLLQELEDARAKASNLDQLSAAVRAIEAKAKVSGLMVQKVEVGGLTQEGPDDADIGGLAKWFAMNWGSQGIVLTPEQAVEFEQVLVDWFDDLQRRLADYAAVNAKSIQPVNMEQVERRRLGLSHGNGRR